jgi:ADP-heptose:LPS heptosyltransferase
LFHVEPGEIYLTDEEKAKYTESDFIYIEPNTKGTFGGNKDWGFDRWQEVVKDMPYRFIQGKGRKLDDVVQISTPTFRDACALLDRALFFVGTDGGLHHAAAALGKRAVVVWGGLVSPKILGYDTHVNLHSGTYSCGSPKACKHCREALDWVTVDMVKDAIYSLT